MPQGHYWTIQIADVFTNVIHQLGSASGTPGGKFLLVGPDWSGEKPDGFIDILRLPTNYGGAFQRSFAARTPEAKERAIAVLDQMGVYPLSQNQEGQRPFDCAAISRNVVYPPGVTAEMIAADPDVARPQWVVPERFWEDLEKMLAVNPKVGADDAAMAEQAHALIALRNSDPSWKALLDRAALAADASLHASARYEQVGVDAGNGWQRQENGGLWGTDWFGRAQAAVVYILVNDYHEAVYLIRAHRRQRRSAEQPPHLHDDISERRAAAGRSLARRLLVADDVRPGLFHAAGAAERPHQHRHRQSRRQGARVRRRRLAHASISRTTSRPMRPPAPTGCRRPKASSR